MTADMSHAGSYGGETERTVHGYVGITVLGSCFGSEKLLGHSEMTDLHLNLSHKPNVEQAIILS